MALSPNYGWAEPDNSSLVKNGAQDIRALGDAIDTSVWNVGYGQAGKNKIINGDFSINQRNFTSSTGDGYGFDRWSVGLSGGSVTYSAQTFTLGSAPVAGYEGKNFARFAVTTGNDFLRLIQAIESVRTFAGQTMTLSFWAKGTNPATAGNLKATVVQSFGTGGSPSATVFEEKTFVLTANWTRYSLTFDVASIAGKTLGTNNDDSVQIWFGQSTNTSTDSYTLDLWGVQAEYGSKATPFQTASGGSPQAELAMCQRYYYRANSTASSYAILTNGGWAISTTAAKLFVNYPVQMRTKVTSLESGGTILLTDDGNLFTPTSYSMDSANNTANIAIVTVNVASGLTQYRAYAMRCQGDSAGYLGFSAEL
jgi:hypothetical protein